jgi:hypothetical protein
MWDSQYIDLHHLVRIAIIAYALMEIWSFEVRVLLRSLDRPTLEAAK